MADDESPSGLWFAIISRLFLMTVTERKRDRRFVETQIHDWISSRREFASFPDFHFHFIELKTRYKLRGHDNANVFQFESNSIARKLNFVLPVRGDRWSSLFWIMKGLCVSTNLKGHNRPPSVSKISTQ